MKLMFAFMFGIFLMSMASALENQGSGKINTNFTIQQTCNDATYITLSTIQYPDRTIQFVNVNMTSLGSGAYQYVLQNTSQIGRYDVTGVSDGCEQTYTFYFDITPSGFLNTIPFLFVFLIIIALTYLLGVNLKNNWIMALGSMLVIFFGFYIIIYGVDIIKNTQTTWAIGLICWAIGVYGMYLSAEGQLAEGGWK